MCWFRQSSKGIVPQQGAISGERACNPARGSSMYNFLLFVTVLGVIFYRHQMLESLKQVPVLGVILAKFASTPYQKLTTNEEGSSEEQAGLMKKCGHQQNDDFYFDEL